MTVAEEGGAVVWETATTAGPWWRRADWGALLVVVVVLASSATGLGNGFAYDDVPIVESNPAVRAWRWPWAYFTETYWSAPWGAALYRPFTIWLFSAQWRIADWAPLTFHLVNVTAYAAAALLLLALARTLVRPAWALLAALAWAVHPVHVEVVANVVGQSELWVALAALTAMLVLQRIAVDGVVSAGRVAGVVGSVAIGLAAKENGIVLPALVAIRWWSIRQQRICSPADVAKGWRMLRAVGYVTVLYLGARYGVLGALGGDGAHLNLAALGTGERILVAVGLLVEVGRLLLVGGPLRADYAPPAFPLHPTVDGTHLLAVALVVAWGLAAWYLERRRGAGWVALWLPLALAPTSNLFFPTGIVLAERSLFLPSIPWVLLLAHLADAVPLHWERQVGRTVRFAAVAVAALVLARAAEASRARQLLWADTPTVVAWSLVDAPTNPRWQGVLGIQLVRMGEFDRAEVHLRAAESLGSRDPRVWRAMHLVLERQGRDAEALEYYRRLASTYGPTLWTELGMEACLLRLRRFSEVRRLALAARVLTSAPEPHGILFQIAESSLVALDSAGASNVWKRSGRPASRSDAPIVIQVDATGRLIRHGNGGDFDPDRREAVVPLAHGVAANKR